MSGYESGKDPLAFSPRGVVVEIEGAKTAFSHPVFLEEIDERPQVYLGGGRDDAWREHFRERFESVFFGFNPFSHSRQGATYEFTNDDLQAVSDSTFVIATVDYHRYTGLALEVGFARALEIPVMLIWTQHAPPRVDSMMAGCASWMFTNHVEAFDFIERRLIPDA